MSEMTSSEYEFIRKLDAILYYLKFYRHEVINKLFPDATPDYKKEWESRAHSTQTFWFALDNHNKKRVIELSLEKEKIESGQ